MPKGKSKQQYLEAAAPLYKVVIVVVQLVAAQQQVILVVEVVVVYIRYLDLDYLYVNISRVLKELRKKR